jgi:uncharacterized protein (TIGR03437 family)
MLPKVIFVAWLPFLALASPDISYTVSTFAGGTYCGDGGSAALAQLGSPEGLAADQAGNLYIADSIDHRVRKVSPDGLISTVAGTGYPGFSGDGGPAQASQLNAPYGLAVDLAGNLYIADLGNARVRKIAPDGLIETIAGGGVAGLTLSQPRNLALDSAGNLYFSDFGLHRVFKLSPSGAASSVAGTGKPGAMVEGFPIQAALAPLHSPAGLVVDSSGTLYIADSGNHQVRKVVNGWMTTVPVPAGVLYTPTGLALDAGGRLYVADKDASGVFKLTPAFAYTAGNGTAGYSGDGGLATLASLTAPRDIVFDTAGYLYIADARPGLSSSIGVVRRVNGLGLIATFAAGAIYHSPGDGGPPTDAHLAAPAGLTLDSAGGLYIADRDDHRLRKVASGIVTTLAGIGVAGSGGDGGFAIRAQLDAPVGVAIHPSGEVWITESAGNRLRRITVIGFIATLSDGLLSAPSAISIDPAGYAYVADTMNQAVRKFSADGVFSTLGLTLNQPTGVCLDPAGDLYISQSGDPALIQVTPDGVAAPLPETGIGIPSRLALDSSGNLFIADTANHRVLKLTPAGAVTTIAGTGSPGYSGDDGPALSAQFNQPADVVVDPSGAIFVADLGNGLIRKLTPNPPQVTGIANAASMLGGPIAPGELVTLFGSFFDPSATQVLFDGQPVPLLYLDAGQINLETPAVFASPISTVMEVKTPAGAAILTLTAVAASPGLFPVSLNADGSLNSAAQPAPPGSVVTLYATGEGNSQPLTVSIANLPAAIVSSQSAAGLLTLQVAVPAACPSGNQPVVFTAGLATSQPGFTIAIQ